MPIDKKKVYTTVKGIAVFPKLVQPDTKFDKGGVYEVHLKFNDKKDEEALIAQLTALANESLADARKEQKNKTIKLATFPWKPEIEKIKDDEGNVTEENETGFTLFKFKLKAQVKTKEGKIIHMKPRLYDGKGAYIGNTEGLDIGGGSTIKVAFTVRPYYVAADKEAGISLQLQGAQIIELVERGQRSAASMGFGAEEGGYDSSDVEAPAMPSGAGESTPASDGDF